MHCSGPSAPLDVQGFCVVVGWRMPSQSNGQLLSYHVHLYTTTVNEGLIETVNSDQTYFVVNSTYKHSGTRVQVRSTIRAHISTAEMESAACNNSCCMVILCILSPPET